jgi:hypothetical protein
MTLQFWCGVGAGASLALAIWRYLEMERVKMGLALGYAGVFLLASWWYR